MQSSHPGAGADGVQRRVTIRRRIWGSALVTAELRRLRARPDPSAQPLRAAASGEMHIISFAYKNTDVFPVSLGLLSPAAGPGRNTAATTVIS